MNCQEKTVPSHDEKEGKTGLHGDEAAWHQWESFVIAFPTWDIDCNGAVELIGRTGMVDSFNVSLSATFIRKKIPDEARTERNVELVYHSCPTNHVIV